MSPVSFVGSCLLNSFLCCCSEPSSGWLPVRRADVDSVPVNGRLVLDWFRLSGIWFQLFYVRDSTVLNWFKKNLRVWALTLNWF